MWGLLHTVSRGDVIRNTLQILEKFMKVCYEQSKIHGPNAREVVVIFDMEGFNLKQYTWRPGAFNFLNFLFNFMIITFLLLFLPN